MPPVPRHLDLRGQSLDHRQPAVIADPRRVIGDVPPDTEAATDLAPALAQLNRDIATQVEQHGSLREVPAETGQNVRNDMYLASETIRRSRRTALTVTIEADADALKVFERSSIVATRFIPIWVKVAVAIALGSARWSDGSGSSSRSARRSARPT